MVLYRERPQTVSLIGEGGEGEGGTLLGLPELDTEVDVSGHNAVLSLSCTIMAAVVVNCLLGHYLLRGREVVASLLFPGSLVTPPPSCVMVCLCRT